MEILKRFDKLAGRMYASVDFTGEKKITKDSFKDECDINTILAKYRQTGVLPEGVGIGRYGDFSESGDYLASLLVIQKAQDQFNALPSEVRNYFKNDPARMLEFVADKANLDKAYELGLLSDEVTDKIKAERSKSKEPPPAAEVK